MSGTLTKRGVSPWIGWLDRLGGRDALRQLADEPGATPAETARRDTLRALLDDPATATWSLRTLCETAGFAKGDFRSLLKTYEARLGQAVAKATVDAHLPDVVETIAQAALGGKQRCPCTYGDDGVQMPPYAKCMQCGGRGYLVVAPSYDHQKLLVEMGGLTPKAAGVTVATQVNVPTLSGDFFKRLVQATDEASLGVVEGKVVPDGND
jgi:hypothetical protein